MKEAPACPGRNRPVAPHPTPPVPRPQDTNSEDPSPQSTASSGCCGRSPRGCPSAPLELLNFVFLRPAYPELASRSAGKSPLPFPAERASADAAAAGGSAQNSGHPAPAQRPGGGKRSGRATVGVREVLTPAAPRPRSPWMWKRAPGSTAVPAMSRPHPRRRGRRRTLPRRGTPARRAPAADERRAGPNHRRPAPPAPPA